jgi:UDP-glucose:(heptosyl)LPS alpha-1,3-glucosyltransferase
MRIAFCLPRCQPDNSHGRYVIELARRMAHSHAVTIYAGSIWRELPPSIASHRLLVPNRPALARISALWVSSFVGVRWRDYDIVHVQSADAPIGNVITAHFCNRAAVADGDNAPAWSLNSRLGALAERYCLTRPSARVVIAVSQALKAEIQRFYRVDPVKVAVIHPGIDLHRFHPVNRERWRREVRRSLRLNSDDFVVLFVGGDRERKGFPQLLQAARAAARPMTILVVGAKRPAEMHQPRVVFAGATADPAPFYAAADCFALPTRYDTFSLATLEAMASGLPVIVCRAAGVSELLTDGHDAMILGRPDDVDLLATWLARLASDEALRGRIGDNARRTAEQHSWDRVVDETLAAYRRALD